MFFADKQLYTGASSLAAYDLDLPHLPPALFLKQTHITQENVWNVYQIDLKHD